MRNNSFLRRTVIIGFATAALAAPIPAAATASAGPAGGPDALQVITMLQRQGDKVIVKRDGNKPLQQCTVTSVREGKSEYWWTHPHIADPRPARRASGVGTQLIYRTMYVDIQC